MNGSHSWKGTSTRTLPIIDSMVIIYCSSFASFSWFIESIWYFIQHFKHIYETQNIRTVQPSMGLPYFFLRALKTVLWTNFCISVNRILLLQNWSYHPNDEWQNPLLDKSRVPLTTIKISVSSKVTTVYSLGLYLLFLPHRFCLSNNPMDENIGHSFETLAKLKYV